MNPEFPLAHRGGNEVPDKYGVRPIKPTKPVAGQMGFDFSDVDLTKPQLGDATAAREKRIEDQAPSKPPNAPYVPKDLPLPQGIPEKPEQPPVSIRMDDRGDMAPTESGIDPNVTSRRQEEILNPDNMAPGEGIPNESKPRREPTSTVEPPPVQGEEPPEEILDAEVLQSWQEQAEARHQEHLDSASKDINAVDALNNGDITDIGGWSMLSQVELDQLPPSYGESEDPWFAYDGDRRDVEGGETVRQAQGVIDHLGGDDAVREQAAQAIGTKNYQDEVASFFGLNTSQARGKSQHEKARIMATDLGFKIEGANDVERSMDAYHKLKGVELQLNTLADASNELGFTGATGQPAQNAAEMSQHIQQAAIDGGWRPDPRKSPMEQWENAHQHLKNTPTGNLIDTLSEYVGGRKNLYLLLGAGILLFWIGQMGRGR